MSDWAVGLSTGCFWQTSIFECLEDIRDSGFGRIEICSFPAHLDYHDVDRVKRAAGLIDELGLETYPSMRRSQTASTSLRRIRMRVISR